MADIGLIPCGQKKLKTVENGLFKYSPKIKAEELYTSELFKTTLEYSKLIHDKTYILSAKHHLLKLDDKIESYNKNLNDMEESEILEWAKNTSKQLKDKISDSDKVYIMTGKTYWKYLIDEIPGEKILLMQGMGFGHRLQWMKNEILKYREKI